MTEQQLAHEHVALSRATSSVGCSSSVLTNGVSRHNMKSSLSFVELKKILDAFTCQKNRLFIGPVDGTLVLTFNPKCRQNVKTSGKRKRDDDHIDRPERIVARLAKTTDQFEEKKLAGVTKMIELLLLLKSSDGDSNVIESLALSPQSSTTNDTDRRPRLVLSCSVVPGTALEIDELFAALGTDYSRDGLITIDTATLRGLELPIGEDSRLALQLGRMSVCRIFATIA